uniref:Uncharacterized protein n=1 Tax=Nelumbo nucifera TaxID=4432 RepID=A0A822YLR0_NELNU|nr:TPA_asm: hypothetical protein HUJ06_011372 [Nelumbo nucifera]
MGFFLFILSYKDEAEEVLWQESNRVCLPELRLGRWNLLESAVKG